MAKRPQKRKAAGSEIDANAAGMESGGKRLPPWFSQGWFLGLMLILGVILAYQPVWQAGFIWDDDDHVTANPCIIGPSGLKEIWTTSCANFFPLTLTTFWVEHALWGVEPLPYHLVNVLMHGACAILLWRVLLGLRVPAAWLGAALWAVHPVEVESVAWISEMKNTESGFFFLLSILFFVRWLRARAFEVQTGGGWNYALTLIFAALAMASKCSTAFLPVVLCLCAWWMEGRWQWRNLARVAPILPMSIAASALSMWVQKLETATLADPQWVRTWPERLATSGDAVWFYLGKLLWPHPLITIYPRWQVDTGWWISYLPSLTVIIVLLILWLKRSSVARPCFFVFVYFLVALLPALGLFDNSIFRYSLVFDHFQYLASMGPLALAGVGLIRLAGIVMPGRPWLQRTFCAGLLVVLGTVSWQRAWAYESEETLWSDTLAKNPSCWAAHNNLGSILYQRGEMTGAMAHFQKALQINPNDIEAYMNLGNVLFQNGQTDGAIAQYQKALEIIVKYQKHLEINLNYSNAQNNLGAALFKKGEVDEAMAHFQEAVRINPGNSDAQHNLAKVQAMVQKAPASK